jgi:Tol biopolymer transport system component
VIGKTLSHYRITAALGAGGMGEVYRATDTRLGRDVAIKVLPAEVTQDPERLGRFEREAHLLAALNHPNIAAIYGLEEADGTPFLALELVEGEDLKERLERGAIPVDEALEIAEQIARALEEAHNKGIVHRDLKPANVKLAPDGQVKVLDFGLAKAWAGDAGEGSASSASMSQSPTLAHSGTAAGIILGTAAYMSPEQARGKAVDKRGDVWAFGVLTWEMLTGRPLFAGDTVTDVIASVVKEEPDLEALPAGTPGAVRRLLSRCLRKDPRKRLPDIGAARLELEDVLAGTVEEPSSTRVDDGAAVSAEVRRLTRQRWIWAAALLGAFGLAAVLAVLHFTEAPEPRTAAHFVLNLPDDLSFPANSFPTVAPDGRHVVFPASPAGGPRRLWIRSLESPETRELPGTEGAGTRPFWSPDGAWVAFTAGGDLKKLNLAGGTVQRICALPPGGAVFGGTWSSEGTIVFAGGGLDASLFSVAAAGGEARPLTTHDSSRGETGHLWPWFLPDGRHILFDVASAQEENSGLHEASLDAPDEKRRLLPGDARVIYASGHLLFVRDATLLAQPFDTRSLEVSGEPAPVVENVASPAPRPDWGWFSVSAGQALAYREQGGTSGVQLAWVDRKGEQLGTVGEPGPYGQIALSPDGSRVAAELLGADGWDLWVIDVSRGVASRLTSDPGNEQDPVWSPDSQEVAFGSSRKGDHFLFRKGLRGEPASPVPGGKGTDLETRDRPEYWSRDGKVLLCKKLNGTTVWAIPLEGGSEAEPVLELGFRLDEPQISPDGRWLAYISEESGAWDVYVQPYRRDGERVRVSVDGGGQPKWRGDGKELFFLDPEGQLMAVGVREGRAGPEVDLPTALFEVGRWGAPRDDYAVSADGQRFLVKVPLEQGDEERFHIVLNWTSLLE